MTDRQASPQSWRRVATMLSHITELEGSGPFYRAILVDAEGYTVSMYRIIASDDAEALVQAQVLVDRHGVDLWDGIRFIDHFPAVEDPA